MPHKTWKHECPNLGNQTTWLGVPECPSCGQTGEYSGLSLSGIEAMGNFRSLTGLPPIGPHKSKLPHFSELCPVCKGHSIIEFEKEDRWVSCKSCNGTGAIVTIPETRFIAFQKEAWHVFDAERLEDADNHKKTQILEEQKRRQYKGIYRRDHYAPKRSRRTIRYFEKMNRLMLESAFGDLDG